MKLVIAKTLWGVDASPSNWDKLFAKIKAEGFDAIECVAAMSFRSDPVLFKQLLHEHDLQLIVQVHTTGGFFKDTTYVYCSNSDKEQHLASFRSQVQEAFEMGAILINCHSGHDSWDLDTALSYFKEALEFENSLLSNPSYSHVKIVHETHRQRLLYSPFQTRDILKNPNMKDLKINADLSHWVCVCERVFDMNDARDASWWPEVLSLVAKHCHLIHARVGHAEGPQICNPWGDDSKAEVEAHLLWWEAIWKEQKARGQEVCFVEPEHGPPPYQQGWERLSQSDMDCLLWDYNNHVKNLVKERYINSNI